MKKILSLLLFTLPAQAVMLTTNKLETVLEHCDKDTLVVFDVDDTLIVAGVKRYPSLMQENVLSLLEQIANKGAKMVALTSREPESLSDTITQLENAGISFAAHCPVKADVGVIMKSRDFSLRHKAGIICCGRSNKAQALEQFFPFLEATMPQVRSLIFVDDRFENVKAVDDMFSPDGTFTSPITTVTSILYTREEQSRLSSQAYAAYCESIYAYLRVRNLEAALRAWKKQ